MHPIGPTPAPVNTTASPAPPASTARAALNPRAIENAQVTHGRPAGQNLSVGEQFVAFMQGFHFTTPQELLAAFSSHVPSAPQAEIMDAFMANATAIMQRTADLGSSDHDIGRALRAQRPELFQMVGGASDTKDDEAAQLWRSHTSAFGTLASTATQELLRLAESMRRAEDLLFPTPALQAVQARLSS